MTLKEIDRLQLTTEDYKLIWGRTYGDGSNNGSFTEKEHKYLREVRLAKVRKAREIANARKREMRNNKI